MAIDLTELVQGLQRKAKRGGLGRSTRHTSLVLTKPEPLSALPKPQAKPKLTLAQLRAIPTPTPAEHRANILAHKRLTKS